ncbi:hypothetical protein ABIB56_001547 [Glaciihabitans sp. UYNi722]
MPEDPLHRFRVSARRDCEACGGVPQLVRGETLEGDFGRGSVEPADAEKVVAQPGLGADAVEHRRVGLAARDLAAEWLAEELRERDRTLLVVLRRLDALRHHHTAATTRQQQQLPRRRVTAVTS